MKRLTLSKEILLSFLLLFLCISTSYSIEIDTTKFVKIIKQNAAFGATIWSHGSNAKYAIIDKDGERDTVIIKNTGTTVSLEEDVKEIKIYGDITIFRMQGSYEYIYSIDSLNFSEGHPLTFLDLNSFSCKYLNTKNIKQLSDFNSTRLTLDTFVISDLPNLDKCNIADCKFKELTLQRLPRLKTLDFRVFSEFGYIHNIILNELDSLSSIKTVGLKIYDIKITKCPNLENYDINTIGAKKLAFDGNDLKKLKNISLTYCPRLERLELNNLDSLEQFIIIDCEKLPQIKYDTLASLQKMVIAFCPKIAELDVSIMQMLKSVTINQTNIKTLDLSNSPMINELRLYNNALLTKCDLSNSPMINGLSLYNNPLLTKCDLSNVSGLKDVAITGSKISVLDLSKSSELQRIRCSSNQIDSVKIPNSKVLWQLVLSDNNIKKIDIDSCTNLTYINLSKNKLSEINISNAKKLLELYLGDNQLTEIDFSNNPAIRQVELYRNKFTIDKLNEAFCTVGSSFGKMCVLEKPNDPEKSEIEAKLNSNILLDKNWFLYTKGEVKNPHMDPFEEDIFETINMFPTFGNYICFDTNEVNTDNVITLSTHRKKLELIISVVKPGTKVKLVSGNSTRYIETMRTEREYTIDIEDNNLTIYGDIANLKCKYWYDTLEVIDLSRCQSLEEFVFHGAYLKKINIDGAKNLRICNLVNGGFGDWEIKDCPNLKELYCKFCKIKNLSIVGAPLLKDLDCDSNEIQELDLSACPNLGKLDCSINPLTKLTLPDFVPLDYLNVAKTKLTPENLNEIYCKLPKTTGQFFGLDSEKDPNFENVMLSSGKNIIEKGWKILYWDVRTNTDGDGGITKRDERTPFFPGGDEDCSNNNYNEVYPLWVSTERVHKKNCNNITAPGIEGKISYDPETNTLTLDNARITRQRVLSRTTYYSYGQPEISWTYNIGKNIFYTGSKALNIELIGKNIIDPVALSFHYRPYELANSYIECGNDLKIYGGGELTLSNESAHNKDNNPLNSIRMNEGMLTIDKCTLNVHNSVDFGVVYANGIELKNNATFYAKTKKGAILLKKQHLNLYDDCIIKEGNTLEELSVVSDITWTKVDYGSDYYSKPCLQIVPAFSKVEESTDNISLYPNPASDFINVNVKAEHIGKELILFNILGDVKYRSMLLANELRISLETLSKGMYIIQIGDERKKVMIK